jgi:hypothetical protein
MNFRLLAGRFLTAADSRSNQRVCVVDEDFARYYWPHTNPLGHRLFQGSARGPDREAFTIVGVVAGAKQAGLTEEGMQGAVYYPYIHRPSSDIFVVMRGAGNSDSLKLALERVVRSIDPELAVTNVQTMENRISDSLLTRRSPALLALLFALLAIILTAVGTYGVLSYTVAIRNREIGIRMALGAAPGRIRAEFLRLALRLFLVGVTLGCLTAALAAKSVQSVLFHVPALSPVALVVAAAVMAVICLLACLAPAFRAARISPLRALAQQ